MSELSLYFSLSKSVPLHDLWLVSAVTKSIMSSICIDFAILSSFVVASFQNSIFTEPKEQIRCGLLCDMANFICFALMY